MAALPYRLYGGATRPDALNFNPGFSQALAALYTNAPPEVQRELGLNSGYRSRAVQEKLFANSDRTGHSVARPGHSKHESGNAADLYGFGLSGGPSVSDVTKAYVRGNAEKYGLYFPMSHEPWHIQYRGDGGGGSLGGTMAAAVGPADGPTPPPHPAFNPYESLSASVNQPSTIATRESLLSGSPRSAPLPTIEVASAIPVPTVGTSLPVPQIPAAATSQLADLFTVKPVGMAARGGSERVAAQAKPLRRRG
jgi:hypothetical protein